MSDWASLLHYLSKQRENIFLCSILGQSQMRALVFVAISIICSIFATENNDLR